MSFVACGSWRHATISKNQKFSLCYTENSFVSAESRTIYKCSMNTADVCGPLWDYKLNWLRNEALPLSKFCPSTTPEKWQFWWLPKQTEYLASHVKGGLQYIILDNFGLLIAKIKPNLITWNKLQFSMWGKTQIVKTAVPQLTIYSQCCHYKFLKHTSKQCIM